MIEILGDPSSIEASMVTLFQDDIRKIDNLITSSSVYEQKTQLREVSGSYYRYVSSKEEKISNDIGEEEGIVYRLRYVYNGWKPSPPILGVNDIDLHITFRTTVADRISQSVSIEVETDVEYDADRIAEIASRVMKLHNGMDIPNLAIVINRMKNIVLSMGLRSQQQLQRPYDLTWRNFNTELIEKKTAISYKADGTRMLLCMSEYGVFYVTSNMGIVPIVLESSNTLPTLLIDGELMGSTYYAFDLLYLNGTNYMDLPYDSRHAYLTDTVRDISLVVTDLEIMAKPIVIPDDEESFHTGVKQMMDVNIDTDGLILTPIEQAYSDTVFKWKPQELMTIDFFIGRGYLLHTFEDGNLRPHPELNLSVPTKAKIGTVAELQYSGDSTWTFMRDRLDKAIPNAERVYLAIKRLIEDPIDAKSMLGLSMKPMRKYHNRVKSAIYEILRSQGISTITDIGAGRGGDLPKYRDGSFSVTAIEPDITNITGEGGFISRASSMGTSIERYNNEWDIVGQGWDVTLLHNSAQDYVPEQESDALTLFNVATFLGPQIMEDLTYNAVKEDGYLVIMAIDGKELEDTFLSEGRSYDSNLISIDRVSCKNIEETFGDLGCIKIRLKDSSTVTRSQIEGLVDTNLMLKNLESHGWTITMDTFLDGDHLLGEEGSAYSSCQRVTILRRSMIGDILVRPIYKPLLPGQIEEIDTPYGLLTRIGVLQQTGGDSLQHAMLEASNQNYRELDNIGKSIYLASLPSGWIPPFTVYLIKEDGWKRYYQGQDNEGITLLENMGHWEPLARRTLDGSLDYVW